jgi:peptidoglycan/xylan/chitin deacetylase (PgdA/CDA1 family)
MSGSRGKTAVPKSFSMMSGAPLCEVIDPAESLPAERSKRERRIRHIAHWFGLRDARYICFRLIVLLRRYGLTASRAKKRALDCVEALAPYDCRPTFPTPGQVVGRNGAFCRQLQQLGAELAIHGYHHLDFRALSASESRNQFARAAAAYQLNGIRFDGFRCPYLGYTEQLNKTIPNDFQYSSNKAVWWDVVSPEAGHGTGKGARAVFEGLSRFYQAESSKTYPAVPRMSGDLVEIPVSLPDDLQLLDGLALDERGMRQAWMEVLRQTHRRGELFNLLFHPESFEQCGPALEAVLREARDLQPSVWMTQLRDINRWWREKSGFTVERIQNGPISQLTFHCSERATVLVRNVESRERTQVWYGSYRVLEGRTLQWSPDERPFIGLAPDTPSALVAFLQEQGYIVDTGPQAPDCAIYLGPTELADFHNQVELIDFIETSSAPLTRFWRWPANARSALCVTGDLDALSLTDYIRRVFAL